MNIHEIINIVILIITILISLYFVYNYFSTKEEILDIIEKL